MGQKTHPIAFRLAKGNSNLDWESKWFAPKSKYPDLVFQDLKIRKFLNKRIESAGLVSVRIERMNKKIKIILLVSRPGLVIGRGGKSLEELKRELLKIVKVPSPEKNLELEVEEFKNPDLSARLVAQRISYQLQRRMRTRQVATKALERIMSVGAVGVKIVLAGRVNGAEISRTEKYQAGKVSLSSLRSEIDYAEVPSLTRSGYVGIKVYINRGEKD
ncbi:30S ribosomal protein S3 [Candidatus Shapirobacteria bacterium]|nr:30S ribosomal protein S3 [Candidatus Shapirobacteria bacterium]